MVEILEKIKSIILQNVTSGGDCGLLNYGCMRDGINHFDYEFNQGINLIVGECATGGWAISCMLSGKNEIYGGKIFFDDIEVDQQYIKQCSCYVGEDAGLKKCFGLKKMTVREQIEYGINHELSFNNDIKQIKKKFGLSNERFNRTIQYFSGERWKASMAIGYALGKRVYCFPWMNTKVIVHLEDCLKQCLKVLLEVGAIIIIPSSKEGAIKSITNEYQLTQLD